MKNLIKSILFTGIMTVFGLAAEKVIFPGYNEFKFFMTVDEVLDILGETNKYIASGSDPQVIQDELYLSEYVSQDFVYTDRFASKNYQFHFFSNIPALKEIQQKSLYHLTDQFKDDFKRIICPVSDEKLRKNWEYQFIFYNHEGTYRLFAVSLSYKGETKHGDDFYVMSDYMFEDLVDKIYNTYGGPGFKSTKKLDGLVTRHFISWFNGFRSKNYNIDVQIALSWVVFSSQKCNFQITYMTPDYFSKYTKQYIANRKYRDVKATDLINF